MNNPLPQSQTPTTRSDWSSGLNADPIPWLLEDDTPAVKHVALRDLFDRPVDDPDVCAARNAAMQNDPIASILAAQEPEGYWIKPGVGYSPKYRGTVWQLMFLDQLGADGRDPRVKTACEYVLSHTQAKSGGFGMSVNDSKFGPQSSTVIHCLNGNLLRALIDFGWLDDPRVQRAVEWQSRSITGDGFNWYNNAITSGPGFSCGINEGLPCAWGAIKALSALAVIPKDARGTQVERAIDIGVEFLLSCDPATASYPAGWGNTKPSARWFKLGFPSGYPADILQNLELICELGHGRDPRLKSAIDLVLSKQDKQGRWKNQYAFNHKTWTDFEKQGQPSKWVTLRACRVLKAVAEAGGANDAH